MPSRLAAWLQAEDFVSRIRTTRRWQATPLGADLFRPRWCCTAGRFTSPGSSMLCAMLRKSKPPFTLLRDGAEFGGIEAMAWSCTSMFATGHPRIPTSASQMLIEGLVPKSSPRGSRQSERAGLPPAHGPGLQWNGSACDGRPSDRGLVPAAVNSASSLRLPWI